MAEYPLMENGMVDWDLVPDEYLTETFLERVEGLKEMFPKKLRSVTSSLVSGSWWAAQGAFSFSRQALWVVSTTSLFMLMPYIIEKEISDDIKLQAKSQQQLLLGHAPMQNK